MADKPFISKRRRGSVVENPDYTFAGLNDRHVDKYTVGSKQNVENRATNVYIEKNPGPPKHSTDTVNDLVREYSTYSYEKGEEIKQHVHELKEASYQMSKWGLIGANSKNNMKHPMVEKYCDFAINLGINNELDTELNMSPEGKLRRKALI